ncbi:GNAT family N-acetyltransferase [Orenia metallireducens]|uniref:GNAT family N-acetyltransferase n=1 Tax=Orenia metallireducens TaxID=1413210 RepID=UPI001FDF2F1D|nr:N-acetyltransferase [Orenia metallireducens]
MQIRIAALKDNQVDVINKLVKIESEAFGEGGLNQWGLVPMIYHGMVYVIWLDKEPIGLAEYMRDMKDIEKGYLYGLAISKSHQGKGFGSKLLDYSLRDLSKREIKKVELTVDPNNQNAVYIYQQKFGFNKVDYRENEYGVGEDRLIMELKL